MIRRKYLNRIGIMAGLLLFAITSGMAAIRVDVDGQPLSFSVPPMQVNGRVMVPLRGIFEALG
ncbi:MAG: stalk domain-containing protein, partial [Armatimonadota bacterium]